MHRSFHLRRSVRPCEVCKAARRRRNAAAKKDEKEDESEEMAESEYIFPMPPPSPPAPSRFLLSKRPGTDEGGSAAPSQTQPRQFIATPRFTAPSTTQPQSQCTTPIVPGSRRPFVSSSIKDAKHPADDIDILDSSQLLEDDDGDTIVEQPSKSLKRASLRKHDSIVANSPSPSPDISSSHAVFGGNQHSYDTHLPAPKRRRITVSPASIEHVSSSSRELSDAENQQYEDDETSHILESEQDEIPHSGLSSSSHYYEDQGPRDSLRKEHAKNDGSIEPIQDSAASEDIQVFQHSHQQRNTAPYQPPKFQEAPRFVATEPSQQRQFFLPDAFSPQRRGARYIAGGLASEVRDWLFQVKSNGPETHYDHYSTQPLITTSTAEYIAVEVSAGPGIQMLIGKPTWSTEACTSSQNNGEDTDQTHHIVKLILAGDGRISGLAGKNVVTQDAVVVVHPPTWEINLQDQGTWTMVCDWSIADDITSGLPQARR
ncbi:hypothetical protein MGG_07208 [Pyricularia oryzae 70-15]|uniref:Uncharacterized protein n=3 Tax=Pyricularia oryzae TaxID=318829 RepID=G4MU13_PYRO7|nr:uncharacterized protein MGG_07208 [Pyricularia oryzae 70-15]EHA55613.1 hypothetical protein MGG_07208 [Pyricularia oryzae 70-15]ELQ35567.1 hypothetical protein OOU_Y34scaffold00703g21 [Pyricularia oryzae Y34]